MITTWENLLMEKLFEVHGTAPFWDRFFAAVAAYSTYLFALIFAALFLCLIYKKYMGKGKQWFSSLLLLPAVLFVNRGVRMLAQRERPFAVEEDFSSLIYHYYRDSFPSNHAAASFAIAGILYIIYPPAGKVLFGAAVLVSAARVYVGIHYPSDVVAGAALALLLLFFFFRYRDSLEGGLKKVWKSISKGVK